MIVDQSKLEGLEGTLIWIGAIRKSVNVAYDKLCILTPKNLCSDFYSKIGGLGDTI